jgi:hypothetical protein
MPGPVAVKAKDNNRNCRVVIPSHEDAHLAQLSEKALKLFMIYDNVILRKMHSFAAAGERGGLNWRHSPGRAARLCCKTDEGESGPCLNV